MADKSRKRNAATSKPPPRKRGWRLLAQKIAIAAVSPVVFLLLLESILWLTGFGRPTGFLVEWRSDNSSYHITNEDFCLQFVPKELSRAPEQAVLAPKGESTIRIFVLGGSAAAGDPDAAFGFCRILETLLNERAGGRTFEVVNAAVTAMNSHVARVIARDCAHHSPDAFIVFMGNNEVIGPYGPHSLPSVLYGSTWIIRAVARARISRVGQLLTGLVRRGGTKKWLGMEAFLQQRVPLGSPVLEDCYGHFQANLRDIVATARDAGAKVVLCTVPTNVRSCAPFGPQHRQGLSEEQSGQWQKHFDQGRKLQKAKRFPEAMAEFAAASQVDDTHATLAYCMAQCADAMGHRDEATPLYHRARDLDALRFRADSRINAIIRDEASASDPRAAVLLDLERTLEGHAERGLIGDDLMLDHVHLNFRANVLVAVAAGRALARVLSLGAVALPSTPEGLTQLEQKLRRRLLYDDHAEYDVALLMYRRKTLPPFVAQLDHAAEMAALRSRLIALRRAVKATGRTAYEKALRAACRESPQDARLLRRLGDTLVRYGKPEEAVELYRAHLRMAPVSPVIHTGLAIALACSGRVEDGVAALTTPAHPFAMDERRALGFIGTALIEHGQGQATTTLYRRVLESDPRSVDALVNLGAAALGAGKPDEAAEYLKRALAASPACVDAMGSLANTFVKRRRPAEAEHWYRKAVAEDPYHNSAHAALALHLARQGRVAEGIEHARRSVHLNPAFVPGYRTLALLYRMRGTPALSRQSQELASLFLPE